VAKQRLLVLLGLAGWLTMAPVTAGLPFLSEEAWAQQAPTPQRQQPRLISLDFKDADIHNLLRILAEFSGLNIVAGEAVKAKVTVRLQNVPWDQALDAVVKAAKLAYVREGNIIRVDSLENLSKEAEAQVKLEQAEAEFKARQEERRVQIERLRSEADLGRQRAELEIKRAQEEAEAKRKEAEVDLRKKEAETKEIEAKRAFEEIPLKEEVIPLKYAHVGTRKVQLFQFLTDGVREEDRKGIEAAIEKMKTGRGEILIDTRTNSLIVRDVPENVERIKRFVEELDKPSPAVQIEARIVELSRDDARALGITWGGVYTPSTSGTSPIFDVRGGAGGERGTSVGIFPPDTSASVFGAGNLFGLTVGWIASNLALDISLQALEAEGRARIISRPSVLTLENEPATVSSGEKIPIISVISVAGAPQASVQFADVTTRLQVVPRITADKRLFLSVGVKRESVIALIQAAGLTAPRTATKQAITEILMNDGQTVVIGGLKVEDVSNKEQGTPFLRSIPLFGWLFKSQADSKSESELMVFLTAKIVEGPGQALVLPPASATTPPAVGAPAATPAAPPAAPARPSAPPALGEWR